VPSLSLGDRELALAILSSRLTVQQLEQCIEAVDCTPHRQASDGDDPGTFEYLSRIRGWKSIRSLVAEAQAMPVESRLFRSKRDRATFLLDLLGIDLLSERSIRESLLAALPVRRLGELRLAAGRLIESDEADIVFRASRIKWHPGKSWARTLTSHLGFPSIFAGSEHSVALPDLEEVETYKALPPLEDFQRELAEELKRTLAMGGRGNRAVLSLPTGAGKTRTVVEATLDWWVSANGMRGHLLWIAQTDELCEQALQAFRQVWIDRGLHAENEHRILTLGRLWGDRNPSSHAQVNIASIQKLNSLVKRVDEDEHRTIFMAWAGELAVVLVDEAHHGVAKSYRDVLTALGIERPTDKKNQRPLVGITATPYRTNKDERYELAKYFDRTILKPEILGTDPLQTLRERGVLAYPDHKVICTSAGLRRLTEDERTHLEDWHSIPPTILRELGDSAERNRLLLEAILGMDDNWSVLFFGCTTQHAIAMATMLRREGKSAEAVLASTRPATRRETIERFRKGDVKILCNFGVLTTGFDAPRVRSVVVARPTVSPVLYEQMIGRGMRGPRFGGTERCLIVDVEDNLLFNGQMAWKRYMDEGYWIESDDSLIAERNTIEKNKRMCLVLAALSPFQEFDQVISEAAKWAGRIAVDREFRIESLSYILEGCSALSRKTILAMAASLIQEGEMVLERSGPLGVRHSKGAVPSGAEVMEAFLILEPVVFEEKVISAFHQEWWRTWYRYWR